MAAIAQVAIAGSAASDFLRSSTTGLFFRGGARISVASVRRDVRVMAKMRRVKKKKERPWPANPNPNVKGGVGTYLSSFKPLTEKPKPAVLAFEKPLVDLEKKIQDVKKMAADANLDFDKQIEKLEKNYQKGAAGMEIAINGVRKDVEEAIMHTMWEGRLIFGGQGKKT